MPSPKVTAANAKLDHPLLQRLHEVDQHIRKTFKPPRRTDSGVGSVGLILDSELKTGSYFCSPENALTFARTGGDGDHYSLLIQDGVIDETSPVILTWPSEGVNTIVGASLYDFLCFGMHGGYFQILFDYNNAPDVKAHDLVFHSHVDDYDQQVLAYMTTELGLKPWPLNERGVRYQKLQSDFRSLLDVSDTP